MNKALHVFVYLFLILSGLALFFELQLNEKREMLTDRNRLQEDYYVNIARTIECADPTPDVKFEVMKDTDVVEARIIDSPSTDNLLEDYNGSLEQANLDTFSWAGKREQLRMIYKLDPITGKPMMDGTRKMTDGPGTEKELLDKLFNATKKQQERLNTTRDELKKMRGRLEEVVEELNALKPVARQDKVTIEEKNAKIAKLEEEKTELENTIVKIKNQIDELNAEITSLKDEVSTAKDETEAVKEELAKAQKLNEQLKKIMQELIAQQGPKVTGGSAVSSLPAGEKAKIVEVDNNHMFAVVLFSDSAMRELKGENPDNPIPTLELGVKRAGFNGPAGEFVGRIRLRQEVRGHNLIVCDILGSWEQDKLAVGDVIFAD